MASRTKTQYNDLYLASDGLINDNSTGDVTPADVRGGFQDLVDSNPLPWDENYVLNPGSGTKFGDFSNSNYSMFEKDTGFLISYGSGIAWDDLRVPGNAVGTGASAPELITLAGGLKTYGFDGANTLEQVYFNMQLPHCWKTGTNISPHIHWAPTTTGTGTVVWFLEYSWANINGSFPAPTTISGITTISTNSLYKHSLTELSSIDGSSISGVSSMLVCRLYRDPSLDTYAADAAFLEFDIHYMIDARGSRTEYSK